MEGAMEGEVVVAEQVRKSFGRLRALDGVSLCVRRGEVYGLLGPNGSGKTTLIRCILGMVRPDSGAVRVLGRRMPDLGVLSRVGYMTQAVALYPDLSVLENVRFFGAINGAEAGALEALRFVELEERRDSVVATLSGGMRTRASLACAIVHRPALLLLDEPTVGVDPQLRRRLWDQFRVTAAEGTAIVVSSHVMDEAERCDRLVLMRDGAVIAAARLEELLERTGTHDAESAFLALVEDAVG
jgi:ABC-2 type transport system ATP-binding protein